MPLRRAEAADVLGRTRLLAHAPRGQRAGGRVLPARREEVGEIANLVLQAGGLALSRRPLNLRCRDDLDLGPLPLTLAVGRRKPFALAASVHGLRPQPPRTAVAAQPGHFGLGGQLGQPDAQRFVAHNLALSMDLAVAHWARPGEVDVIAQHGVVALRGMLTALPLGGVGESCLRDRAAEDQALVRVHPAAPHPQQK